MFIIETSLEETPVLAPGRVVRWQAAQPFENVVELEMPAGTDPVDYGGYDAWVLPFGGAPEVLAVLYAHELAMYSVSDLAGSVGARVPIRFSLPTVWTHRSPEFGGAIALGTRFMMDIDGDADLDFVEICEGGSDADRGPCSVAIHAGASGMFDVPYELPVSPSLGVQAESPFVQVGRAEGMIFVNVGSGDTLDGPPTFQMLECAPE
jgi:hypothetical protein